MKKLAFLLTVLFLSISTFGQTTTTVTKDTKKHSAKTEMVKPTPKSQTYAVNHSKTSNSAVDNSKTHLKKDGTADKRFKENSTTVKTTGPVKKDGTPDMRYKSNQETTNPKK